jgi:hypothetical protein
MCIESLMMVLLVPYFNVRACLQNVATAPKSINYNLRIRATTWHIKDNLIRC